MWRLTSSPDFFQATGAHFTRAHTPCQWATDCQQRPPSCILEGPLNPGHIIYVGGNISRGQITMTASSSRAQFSLTTAVYYHYGVRLMKMLPGVRGENSETLGSHHRLALFGSGSPVRASVTESPSQLCRKSTVRCLTIQLAIPIGTFTASSSRLGLCAHIHLT